MLHLFLDHKLLLIIFTLKILLPTKLKANIICFIFFEKTLNNKTNILSEDRKFSIRKKSK